MSKSDRENTTDQSNNPEEWWIQTIPKYEDYSISAKIVRRLYKQYQWSLLPTEQQTTTAADNTTDHNTNDLIKTSFFGKTLTEERRRMQEFATFNSLSNNLVFLCFQRISMKKSCNNQ
jgi:hypothetical protein